MADLRPEDCLFLSSGSLSSLHLLWSLRSLSPTSLVPLKLLAAAKYINKQHFDTSSLWKALGEKRRQGEAIGKLQVLAKSSCSQYLYNKGDRKAPIPPATPPICLFLHCNSGCYRGDGAPLPLSQSYRGDSCPRCWGSQSLAVYLALYRESL